MGSFPSPSDAEGVRGRSFLSPSDAGGLGGGPSLPPLPGERAGVRAQRSMLRRHAPIVHPHGLDYASGGFSTRSIRLITEDLAVNRGGFSWKRLLGISAVKSRVARQVGIPLTRSGRQRKFGAAMGCVTLVVALGLAMLAVATFVLR